MPSRLKYYCDTAMLHKLQFATNCLSQKGQFGRNYLHAEPPGFVNSSLPNLVCHLRKSSMAINKLLVNVVNDSHLYDLTGRGLTGMVAALNHGKLSFGFKFSFFFFFFFFFSKLPFYISTP
ncbi:hypothetical protein RND81_10G070200 [Saponaria officinalis]|uniref:Uncharacterized protein n=1 Tax=Saponaria officinalis TaxID=3572 RepID=A0AAW1I1I5_SAPOF